MATLEIPQIKLLLRPYLQDAAVPELLFSQLSNYLDLLLKWNAKTNLTAIRDPEEIVQRHFGESFFMGLHLPSSAATLLDFGSGAGLPGLPIQLFLPQLSVTLAESQNKKASFLREAVRTLGLKTEVWSARVETMPEGRLFDVVALRAVDNMVAAMEAARPRIRMGGTLAVLTSGEGGIRIPKSETTVLRLTAF